MATELAKAYVQIIPSAQGIKGKITEALGGESESAGNSAGESFGKNLIGKLKGIIVAAGIGKILTDTINEGAALQQSIGGIETLFKDSAGKMKQYADEAYKTAGMSANDYMETVTGFSASLLQGLGGDTEAAANVANMAIIDMSDNANKMGTSIENIQNAYQGFAKQNYTMLDNLKLGYGGTKSEMERLLADAQKISGVRYNLDNLSDVYEAIHVIQGELDITGTTAKEAASTLSGSMASMKSAFTNVLGNLALGEDIGPSLNALMDSVFIFLTGNLIPMVANIIRGAPQVLGKVLSAAIGLLNIASRNADEIIQIGVDLISQLVVGIVSALPYLAEGAIRLVMALGNAILTADWPGIISSMISQLRASMEQAGGEILGSDSSIIEAIGSSITENLPNVLEKGIEIISNLANGILQNLPAIFSSIGSILSELVAFIMKNLPTILQAGVKLIQNLAQGLVNNLPAIISSAAKVIAQLLATIAQHLPDILQSGIKLIGQLVAGLIQAIPDIIRSIPQIISSIVSAFSKYDWKSIGGDIIAGIGNGIKEGVGAITDAVKNAAKKALDAAKEFLGINSPSTVMRDQVGHWIPAGMAVGIEKNTEPIKKAMQELTKQTTGTLQTDLELGVKQGQRTLNRASSSVSGNAEQAGGFIQNVTINSPTELSPYEVSRQMRNTTRNMILAVKGVK